MLRFMPSVLAGVPHLPLSQHALDLAAVCQVARRGALRRCCAPKCFRHLDRCHLTVLCQIALLVLPRSTSLRTCVRSYKLALAGTTNSDDTTPQPKTHCNTPEGHKRPNSGEHSPDTLCSKRPPMDERLPHAARG
jgi:hypothetical protein